jgi:hypothetical protein
MSDNADGPPKPPAKPGKAPRAFGGAGRGFSRLKLLGSLRGEGRVIWKGGEAVAAYELDLYSRGADHTAGGHLEGDFAKLEAASEAADGSLAGVKLRLSAGREIGIDLASLDAEAADFDAQGDVPPSILKAP